MRVLITRPEPDASRTAALVAERGHEPVIAPLSTIRPTGASTPPRAFDAVIATSRNAVAALVGSDAVADLVGLPFYAVGTATAAAASAAGFGDVREGGGTAERLADRIRAELPPGSRLFYAAGRPRKSQLETALDRFFTLDVVEVYVAETPAALPQAAATVLEEPGDVAILHASRGAAEALLALAGFAGMTESVRRALHVAVSEDAADPLRRAGCRRVEVSPRPVPDAMPDLLPSARGSGWSGSG